MGCRKKERKKKTQPKKPATDHFCVCRTMVGITTHVQNENESVKTKILESKQMSLNCGCSLRGQLVSLKTVSLSFLVVCI